ncbi:multi-sensor hybrid histidine kinase [Stanieria cyanosphaera PCC 7437]|uniref:Circadian input-output histidine kinase CikA n=1 Tax=Stanieria cyanosphaera (strain ATCC 29371 / PCC 7437) TaxID=111780 RepID=K9XPV2_STAC7|nr:PAS domain S-box protein [Stanieria cyanosphaera]AFZ34119.1 multi-sensor hybrid histidine kinase [Stanieria cyanosphaera PCC 7437]
MFFDLLAEIDLSNALIHNPLSVASNLKIAEAISLMSASRTTCELDLEKSSILTEAQSSCVLVVENNQLVGILTAGDVVRLATKKQLLTEITLAEVISHPVVTLQQSELSDLFVVLNLFENHQISHLPVVDQQGLIVGLLTAQSLEQLFVSIDWLRFRQVAETQTSQVIHAQLTTSVATLTQLMADHQVSSVVIVEEKENHKLYPIGIVSAKDLVQLLPLELNLAQVQAQQVMSFTVYCVTPDDSLRTVWMMMQHKQIEQVVIQDHQDCLLGTITLTDLLKAFNPVEIYCMVDKLEKRVSQLEAEKLELIESQSRELEKQVQKRTTELQTQYQKERLVADITSQIRESLNLQNVLNTTVAAVRSFLQCDRVLLYQFDQNWNGKVVVESVSKGELSIINQEINDPCLISKWHNLYQQGWITSIDNVETSLIESCHKEMLANFQVRANLVLPILQDAHLWGLLIVHECCQPRHWHLSELDLLKQITEQVAIALQQAAAYEQAQIELEERRRTEQALRESEAQLKLAFAAARMGSWNWNIQKGKIKWSDNMESLFGLEPGQFDGSYEMFVASLHPQDRDRVLSAINHAVTTGANYDIEFRVVFPDGTMRWALSQGKVFYDHNGQPVQMAGVDLDISARKEIETELYQLNQELEQRVAERTADLQQSEARLQEAQKIARMGNWEFDVITEKITWSPEVFQIFGLDPESSEPIYKDLNQYIHPDSRDYHQFLVNRAIVDAESYETDLKILRQDGTSGYMFVKGQAFCNQKNQVVRLFGIVMDITERKQAEAEIQLLQERLQYLLSSSPTMIFACKPDGDFGATFISDNIKTILGYTSQEFIADSAFWFSLIHPEDLDKVRATLVQISELEYIRYEYRLLDKDGNYRWMQEESQLIVNQEGQAIEIVGSLSDITERKQTEAALEQYTREVEDLYNNSPCGYHSLDTQGRYLKVNQTELQLLGYTREEMIGKGIWEFFTEASQQNFLTNFSLFKQQGWIKDLEYEMICKDGSVLPVMISAIAVKDEAGKLLYNRATLVDITERKQAEAAIAQSAREVEDLYNNAPCGYHSLDAEGRFIRVNNTELQFLGYTREEMLGRFFVEFITESSRNNFIKNFPLFKQRGWVKELEYEMICKDGSILNTMLSASAVKNVDGTFLYSRSTVVDITERKRAELALQASEAKLQGIIQSAPGFITTFDRHGTITYVNRTTESFSVEQVIGRNISEFLLPQYQDLQNNSLKRLFEQGETVQFEVEGYVDQKGNTTWYRVQTSPVWDGEQVVMGISTAIDISDLKQAETDLRESENRYATLAETAPVGIFRVDTTGKSIYVNHYWVEMTGRSKEAVLGDGWIEALHPEDREQLLSKWSESIKQQQFYRNEARFLRPDGSIVWFFCRALPETNLEGKIVGYIGTVTDISELKQTEAALRESERRYATLAENIPVALFRFNSEGDCIYVNERWQTMTGRPTQSALGKGWLEAVHPEDRDRIVKESKKKLTEPSKFQSEGRHLLPDGTIKWFLTQTLPEIAPGGQQIGFFGTLTDITERKKAEHIIHQQAQRELSLRLITQRIRQSLDLNIIFDTAVYEIRQFIQADRVAIYRFNSDWSGNFVAESMTEGWTPLVGTLPKIRDTHLQETQGGRYAHNETFVVNDIYQVGHAQCHLELLKQFEAQAYAIAPIFQGEKLWGLLAAYQNSAPRHWEEDEISLLRQIGWQLGVALQQADLFKRLQKELTERKQAEAKLQHMNQQLELSNQQLERATSLKDEFLANMSHEFRTPLNTILGMSEALQEEVFGNLNEEQQKTIAAIESSGRHLLELINDILDVAKIEAGKLELHLSAISLQQLCQSSLIFIQQQAIKKRIQLNTKITSDLGVIQVDQRRMRQVLINLLNNAVKFTPSGGLITLEVQVESAERYDNAQTNQLICFSVIDTGIGIAAENLNQLFQPFIQIDSALNRQYSGTGLGLSLVKQITELHGGFVTVSSELGCGSCFKVYLPYTPQANETKSSELISASRANGLETIPNSVLLEIPQSQRQRPVVLLAEDNQANAETFADYLESRGYQIIVAQNGQEAIEFAITHNPDLIIIDIQLSMIDGLETIRHLRTISQFISIPIIALTCSTIAQDRENGLAAGATEYLIKPVRLKQLVTTIEQLLN